MNRAASPIRVVVVDDQVLVRTGFRLILETEDDFEVVGEAGDGQEALELIRAERPDVALMDVRMPRMDGVEATRLLQDDPSPSPTKVIIVTTFDLDEYVFAALRHGASGFLLKDAPSDQLVAAVRAVASGEALLAPSVTRRLIERFQTGEVDDGPANPGTDGRLDSLTEREVDVLVELARGLSNAEIARKLIVGETTVKTHVGRILAKLQVRDRVQAVVVAYETGLIRPGVDEQGTGPSPTPS
jgi:DNA-binding NarL/FixJ family response regulator